MFSGKVPAVMGQSMTCLEPPPDPLLRPPGLTRAVSISINHLEKDYEVPSQTNQVIISGSEVGRGSFLELSR
jgi:hypothetical protein